MSEITLQSLDCRVQSLETKFDKLDVKLDKLDDKVNTLSKETASALKKLNIKIDSKINNIRTWMIGIALSFTVIQLTVANYTIAVLTTIK